LIVVQLVNEFFTGVVASVTTENTRGAIVSEKNIVAIYFIVVFIGSYIIIFGRPFPFATSRSDTVSEKRSSVAITREKQRSVSA